MESTIEFNTHSDSEYYHRANGQRCWKTNDCGFLGVTNMAEWSSYESLHSELLTVGFLIFFFLLASSFRASLRDFNVTFCE